MFVVASCPWVNLCVVFEGFENICRLPVNMFQMRSGYRSFTDALMHNAVKMMRNHGDDKLLDTRQFIQISSGIIVCFQVVHACVSFAGALRLLGGASEVGLSLKQTCIKFLVDQCDDTFDELLDLTLIHLDDQSFSEWHRRALEKFDPQVDLIKLQCVVSASKVYPVVFASFEPRVSCHIRTPVSK